MTCLAKFQMKSEEEYHPATNKLDPLLSSEGAKHVHELLDIDTEADFIIMGKIVDLKYEIYNVRKHFYFEFYDYSLQIRHVRFAAMLECSAAKNLTTKIIVLV